MQAKKRYALTLITCLVALVCYLTGRSRWPSRRWSPRSSSWRARLTPYRAPLSPGSDSSSCSMSSCFDLTLPGCRVWPAKHHIYPELSSSKLSETMLSILNLLQLHPLYTSDPSEACLFFLSLDTLDRDPLSTSNFVADLDKRLESIKNNSLWNGGSNHVVLNLYSGTYPHYNVSDLHQLDIGKAILAQASSSRLHYREGFDISLPLFHPTHPIRSGQRATSTLLSNISNYIDLDESGSNQLDANKSLLLAFKGKRYVYGQGSETRNGLHHLHNGDDVILLTTCKHGRNWQALKDQRCDEDNLLYDK